MTCNALAVRVPTNLTEKVSPIREVHKHEVASIKREAEPSIRHMVTFIHEVIIKYEAEVVEQSVKHSRVPRMADRVKQRPCVVRVKETNVFQRV